MITKPLSEQSKFKSSLTLVSEYSSNPGVNGLAEIAVYQGKQKVAIWSWVDEWGSECIASFSPKTSVREMISSLMHNDLMTASVYASDVTIINDIPPLGELLRLIWGDDEDNKKVAELLLHLSEKTLNTLCSKKDGLLSKSLHQALLEVSDLIDESNVSAEDLPYEIDIATPTPAAISKRFKASIQEAENALTEKHTNVSKSLAPFADSIEMIVRQWSADKKPSRMPGGAQIPNPTIGVLRTFLNEYALSHDTLPVGIHTVSGITRVMSSSGSKVEFVVDFDKLK